MNLLLCGSLAGLLLLPGIGAAAVGQETAEETVPGISGSPSARSAQPPDPEQVKLAKERLRELSVQLGLTEEQKEKIQPILLEDAPKIKELLDNPSISRQERRYRARQILKYTYVKIQPFLTPEQAKKLDSLREEAVRKRLAASGRKPAG